MYFINVVVIFYSFFISHTLCVLCARKKNNNNELNFGDYYVYMIKYILYNKVSYMCLHIIPGSLDLQFHILILCIIYFLRFLLFLCLSSLYFDFYRVIHSIFMGYLLRELILSFMDGKKDESNGSKSDLIKLSKLSN